MQSFRALLDFGTDSGHKSAVRACSRLAEEVARLAAGLFRNGETQSDTAILSPDDAFGGTGQIPGKRKLLREDVGRSAGNTASGTRLQASPLTASFTVPSPPQTITS